MHSKSSNYIGYTGTVSCTFKKHNKILSKSSGHNSGQDGLFTFLAKCLTGNYSEANSLRPNYVVLTDENGTECTQKKAISQVAVSESDKAVLSFIIEYSDWISTTSAENVKQLKLIANDTEELLAIYTLNEKDLESWGKRGNWTPTTALVIDWQLELSNKTTESTTPLNN